MKQVDRNPMWAITTFYNPSKYQRRLMNYRLFKQNLKLPLVTVELSFNGEYELNSNDADILLQVSSDSVLWQKERLLNLALAKIPEEVKYVAWLDCDIIFATNEWIEIAIEKLQNSPIIQAFSVLFDLASDTIFNPEILNDLKEPTGYSITFLNKNEILRPEDFRPTTTPSVRRGLFGLAWVARKEILSKHGFYDVMILGSGDRAFACACFGRFDDFIKTTHLNSNRTLHYLNWAENLHDNIQGKVDYIEGTIYHLWHGDIKNRRYMERHIELSKFNFNPYNDVKINDSGCWEWNTNDELLKKFPVEYFASRKEDDSQN